MSLEEKSLVGRNPEMIRPYLMALFKALDDAGITWAVMRGWERLPEWTRYDVDILVASSDLKRTYKIAELLGREHGWSVPKKPAFFTRRPIWLFRVDESGFSSFRLDIMDYTPFQWRWKDDPVKCLKARERSPKGFWMLPLWYVGGSVLVKELSLHGKIVGDLRFAQMQRAAEQPEFRALLQGAFEDADLIDRLVVAAKERNADEFEKQAPTVNGIIAKKSRRSLCSMLAYIVRGVCKRLSENLSFFVVLIGPDGCGKTTIADHIQATFKGRPFGTQIRIKSDFGMPRLRNLKSVAYRLLGKNPPVCKEPPPGTRHMGMQKPHSCVRAMTYVLYYGLGMVLGRIRILLSYGYCRQIVADRYFYDYYYQNGFRNCPRWFVRMMELFAPKPDLIIVLDRPAQDIYNRKPELTVGEIDREQKIIMDIFGKQKRCCVVNAGDGLEAALERVEKAVAERFIARWCK